MSCQRQSTTHIVTVHEAKVLSPLRPRKSEGSAKIVHPIMCLFVDTFSVVAMYCHWAARTSRTIAVGAVASPSSAAAITCTWAGVKL